MLAVVKSNRYPDFDSLELEQERDLAFRPWLRLNPVKTGDIVPDFIFEKDNNRWQHFLNGVETHHAVPLRQLLNKTLVIAFYSSGWQDHGLDMLSRLSTIQLEARTNDANLLVIHAEKGQKLEKLAWDNNLSLSFYFDPGNNIAERFGIYSENDPVWNRFSGIDNNVPLLATYVIAPYGKILYDHINRDFRNAFPSENVLLSLRLQGLHK